MNQICSMICHKKNDRSEVMRLQRILDRMQRLKPDRHGKHRNLQWGSNSRCRYGLPCPSLQQIDIECRRLQEKIEGCFVELIKADDGMFFDVLRLLQGYYPAVYVYLERERARQKEKKSKWAEIRGNYYDDIEEVQCIDGWLTGDDSEEGQVIAKVHLDTGTVDYLDEDAKHDRYAQEVIREVLENGFTLTE